jgi:hypothetical protein
VRSLEYASNLQHRMRRRNPYVFVEAAVLNVQMKEPPEFRDLPLCVFGLRGMLRLLERRDSPLIISDQT